MSTTKHAQHFATPLHIAMVSETYLPYAASFINQAIALIGISDRIQHLRTESHHAVELLTRGNIVEQLRIILENLANSQGVNYVQTEFSPER